MSAKFEKRGSILASNLRNMEKGVWFSQLLRTETSMSKAYIPPERKIPGVGGWRWALPPTPEFCVGDTNMLVSKM